VIRVAALASGEGTTFQALLDACRAGQIPAEMALLISSRAGAGAIKRAQAAGVEAAVLEPAKSASPADYSRAVAEACRAAHADLVCLAGFLVKLEKPFLDEFAGRAMNVHPSLLPAFGGQSFYGRKVHEAALAAGARVSGCTVHFLDERYDHGPIISQAAVPVVPDDTPETLSERVRLREKEIYASAVRLFAEGRLRLENGRVSVSPPGGSGASDKVRRALLSVSDKTGLADFARGLSDLGVEIIASGGTAKALAAAGVPARPVESLTGFPEILSGRVKTLHPAVHGGLLMRRDDATHLAQAQALGIVPIDLVAVDLYPFSKALARSKGALGDEAVENIDIGGVALLRAAAKNFSAVAAASSPEDYAPILSELRRSEGKLSLETRRGLALSAFKRTAAYDAQIAAAFAGDPAQPAGNFPATLSVALHKIQDLRYGENAHQKAALYGAKPQAGFVQLHGKELSYNNLLDAAGAWEAASEFSEPACVVFKHVSPCGAAVGKTIAEAFTNAWACDPLSAFGSVLGFNRPVTAAVAADLEKRFVEVLVAPAFEPEALAILRKKQNVRLMVRPVPPGGDWQLRSVGPEVLVSEPDRELYGSEWKVVSARRPSAEEEAALRFAWACAKHARSNAVVLAGPKAAVGIGGGQTSRVDAVFMAGVKYKEYLRAGNAAPAALVLASDAFFPFRDGVDSAASLGARAIVAPKGSIRDADVIKAADENNLALVFTGLRHFKH